jgi:hypothetical protein
MGSSEGITGDICTYLKVVSEGVAGVRKLAQEIR